MTLVLYSYIVLMSKNCHLVELVDVPTDIITVISVRANLVGRYQWFGK